jgi:hypothetical protein
MLQVFLSAVVMPLGITAVRPLLAVHCLSCVLLIVLLFSTQALFVGSSCNTLQGGSAQVVPILVCVYTHVMASRLTVGHGSIV